MSRQLVKFLSRRGRSVLLQPALDPPHHGIDLVVVHAQLAGDELYQQIDALDVLGTRRQCPRRR